MSEELAQKTMGGIYEFCKEFIKKEDDKEKVLNHLNTIFINWSESWEVIKNCIHKYKFQNKEQVLLTFIKEIPQLKIFESVILDLISHHPSFWDSVYKNLCECKSLLLTEVA